MLLSIQHRLYILIELLGWHVLSFFDFADFLQISQFVGNFFEFIGFSFVYGCRRLEVLETLNFLYKLQILLQSFLPIFVNFLLFAEAFGPLKTFHALADQIICLRGLG